MKLNEVLNAANGQVCGGSEFQWKCFGPNARFLELADINGEEVCNIVFDSKDQTVYEIEAYVNEDMLVYKWIDPHYLQALKDECVSRDIAFNDAYDEVEYTFIDTDVEILDLVHKIVHKTYVHVKQHVERDLTLQSAELPDDEDEHAFNCDDIRMSMAGGETEYEVGINVAHILSVKANSMEEAVCKAKKFTNGMKPSGKYPDGVSWVDCYVAKERVSRELATEQVIE